MKRSVLYLAALALMFGGVERANAGFINGNFGTGDLTGWTVFTTPNGTNGTLNGVPLPNVVSFDTTGTGATNSAQFEVGIFPFHPPRTEQGGGLSQNVTLSAGSYIITGDFASYNPDSVNTNLETVP
jgi:fermentation-respiration switch protein FrsA (DUF1100 family)